MCEDIILVCKVRSTVFKIQQYHTCSQQYGYSITHNSNNNNSNKTLLQNHHVCMYYHHHPTIHTYMYTYIYIYIQTYIINYTSSSSSSSSSISTYPIKIHILDGQHQHHLSESPHKHS